MKKKVIERAVPGFFIGIAIGQIISVLISLMSGNGEFIICVDEFVAQIGNEALAAAVQTLLCGIMGSGFAAASVIWELENISIAAQSGICFGIYAICSTLINNNSVDCCTCLDCPGCDVCCDCSNPYLNK